MLLSLKSEFGSKSARIATLSINPAATICFNALTYTQIKNCPKGCGAQSTCNLDGGDSLASNFGNTPGQFAMTMLVIWCLSFLVSSIAFNRMKFRAQKSAGFFSYSKAHTTDSIFIASLSASNVAKFVCAR